MPLFLAAFLSILTLASTAFGNGRPPATTTITLRDGNPNDIILGATFGSLVSHDRGATWHWICEVAVGYSGIDPIWAWLADGTMLATVPDGVSISSDGGCMWGRAAGTESRVALDIRVHPTEPATVLAALLDTGTASQILSSTDSGRSFGKVLYTVNGRYITGVRYVRGAPQHLYAVTVSFVEQKSSVLHSADGGTTWDDWPFTYPSNYNIRLLDTDPGDPRVVFVSSPGPNTLLRSENFGQTFSPALVTDGLIVALAIEDNRVLVSDTAEGAHFSADRGLSFSPLAEGSPHAACLASDGKAFYACGSSLLDGFVLGRSDDGMHFVSLMRWFDEIQGPFDCPPGTDVNDSIFCEPQWPALKESFRASRPDGGAILDGGSGKIPKKHSRGCGCSVGAGSATGLAMALALSGLALVRMRSRRRRT